VTFSRFACAALVWSGFSGVFPSQIPFLAGTGWLKLVRVSLGDLISPVLTPAHETEVRFTGFEASLFADDTIHVLQYTSLSAV
jgi:hypothetical protein